MIEQQQPGIDDSSHGKVGPGIRNKTTGGASKASSVVSDGQESHRPFRGVAKVTSPGSQPMFFRADDIRPGLHTIPSEQHVLDEQMAGARGARVEDDYGTGISTLSISTPLETPRPKFIYANGTTETKIPTPKLATPSKLRSPKVAAQPPQRATSPLKDEILSRELSLSTPAPRQHTNMSSNTAECRDPDKRIPEPLSVGQPSLSRSSSLSIQGQRRLGHVKSSSVSAMGSNSVRRPSIALSDGPFMISSKFYPPAEARTATDARPPSPSVSDSPHPQSPMILISPSLGLSKLEHANEQAADARRERKVLDLEISNSSLLAINRTLEREMRKQQAELRRLRRQNHFGYSSATYSSHFNSKKISMLSEIEDRTNDDHFSEQSSPALSVEEVDGDHNDYNDNDSSSKLSSSCNNSLPDDTIFSSHDALKDSKCINLEYSRHRSLLIDSQKMNQSIERCLGCTEDLIAAGRKALEYRVDVLGFDNRTARVLLPDELEVGMWGPGQGLLSPETVRKEMMWEEEGDRNGGLENSLQSEEIEGKGPYGRLGLEEGEILPRFEKLSRTKMLVVELESETESKTGWDRIKADVQTPDDVPGSCGVQDLRDYISTLSKTGADII